MHKEVDLAHTCCIRGVGKDDTIKLSKVKNRCTCSRDLTPMIDIRCYAFGNGKSISMLSSQTLQLKRLLGLSYMQLVDALTEFYFRSLLEYC